MLRDPSVEEAVAAKVASHELWILCLVQRVLPGPPAHVVAGDIDTDRTFTLDRDSEVRTLPSLAEIASARWVKEGLRVLALYPDTTSFYPATVGTRPSILGGAEECAGVFF
jgi:hypothetical protein